MASLVTWAGSRNDRRKDSVPDLAHGAAVFLVGVLVTVFAVDHQAATIHLDVDVLLDVDARQFHPYDRVVAILDHLGGGAETAVRGLVPVRGRGGAKEFTQPPVCVPRRTRPQCDIAHGISFYLP